MTQARVGKTGTFPAYIQKTCLACTGTEQKHFMDFGGYKLVICQDCGFMFTRNVPSSDELTKFYSGIPGPAKNIVPKRNTLRNLKYRALATYLRQLMRGTRHIRLLELGCSDGDLLDAVKDDPAYEASGLEIGAPHVENGRSRGLNVLEGDIESAKFETDSFDVIVALHVVEHLQNPERSFAEILRVLKPGGYFFAVMPSISHIKAKLAGKNWKYICPPAHLWYFGTDTLRKFAERMGFECRYTSSIYHRAHVRMLVRKPLS